MGLLVLLVAGSSLVTSESSGLLVLLVLLVLLALLVVTSLYALFSKTTLPSSGKLGQTSTDFRANVRKSA